MTLIDSALEYIKLGFKVFPVKPDKTPLTPHGLKDATQTQLGVREYWGKWPNAGIGLVTDGLVVLDFDVKNGGIESKTKIENDHGTLPRTRLHKTGGGGWHYIYRNPNGTIIRNTVAFAGYPGVDIRANGGYIVAPPSPHLSGNNYELIDDCEITPAPPWVVEIYKQKPESKIAKPGEDATPIPDGQRNFTLARLAGSMRRNGMPEVAILAALKEVNNLQCQPPLPEDEVITISKSISRYAPQPITTNDQDSYIDEAVARSSNVINVTCKSNTNVTPLSQSQCYKNVTESVTKGVTEAETLQKSCNALADRVLDWVKQTTSWWDTTDLDKDLGISTAKDKGNRRIILYRLREQGIIEPHQKINKQYRFINTKITNLSFKTATNDGTMNFLWPMGIEKYCNLYPGNMAVIAGSPNAGKTALLLNVIKLNQDKFPIYYFCSEMGAVEIRSRLDKFPDMKTEDWKFEAIERASDFADVVRPDCINIIDYLEMTTDLYAVNTHLTGISHRIGTGLAIVAVQKKVGAVYGRGQEFGLEKPKIYLSLDRNKLKIIKGKSWVQPNVDPHGLERSFKIVGGCEFVPSGNWKRPEDEY